MSFGDYSVVALTLTLGTLNLCLGFAAAMYLGYGPPGLAEAWQAFWPKRPGRSASNSTAETSLAAAVQAVITADPESEAVELDADLTSDGPAVTHAVVASPEQDPPAEVEPPEAGFPPLAESLNVAEPELADEPSKQVSLSESCRTTVDAQDSVEAESSGDPVETLLIAEIGDVRSAWNDLHQDLLTNAEQSEVALPAVASDEPALT